MTDATTTSTDKAGEPVDALYLKLVELIDEQSCGEWGDLIVKADAKRFAEGLRPMITHPQPSLSVGLDRSRIEKALDKLERVRWVREFYTDGRFVSTVVKEDIAPAAECLRSILALSPPAEGGVSSDGPYSCIRCDNSTWNDDDICDACAKEARDLNDELDALGTTPTPAPVDHIGDATEKVDWERVGPKLVEFVQAIAEISGDRAAPGFNEAGRLFRINQRAHEAMAAAQPEGK